MTVLSAQSIRGYCVYKNWLPSSIATATGKYDNSRYEVVPYTNAMITPFVERGISRGRSYGLSSAGYDIRIGRVSSEVIDPNDWDNGHGFRMMPGDFVLASSIERIKMPNDLMCIVHDKSSWAREGLAIQNTVLEPGWEGYITLELSFHRPRHNIIIHKGDPIAQLIFHKLDQPTTQPYKGKYQNQEDRPVEAILEEGGGT